MNGKTALGLLIVTAALACARGGLAQEGRWTDPRAKLLPIAKGLQGMVVKLGDGSLLTVEGGNTIFDKNSKRGAVRTSKDGGKTWSAPRPIYEGPPPGIPSDAGVLLLCRSGTLVLVYMDISSYKWGWDDANGQPHDDVRLDVWSIRSLDEGKTWIDRRKLFEGYCGALNNIIQTSGGRVVVPVQRLLRDPGRHAMCTYTSGDDGKTWQRSNIIDLGGAGHHDGAMEGTVGELPDGRLLMLIRTRWGRFWEAFSEDEGLSWRVIQPSRIEAASAPGFLVGLASGRLALLYNPLKLGRQELSIAFLAADGKSWSRPVAIARDKGQQLAYPHAFEPGGGELWVMNRWPPKRPPLCLSLREDDFATSPAPIKIVALGDSTTALRSSIRKVYCRRLAETLPLQGISAWVINSGVGGSTTRHARARFEKDVLAQRPDLVIIMLGANDSAIDVWKDPPATEPRVGKQEYAENLRHFVSTLEADGAKVLLATPAPFRWTPKLKKMYGKPPYDVKDPWGFSAKLADYCDVVRAVAREKDVPLVDVFKAFQEYDRVDGQSVDDLLLDGMHPNDKGHAIIAELLVPAIEKACVSSEARTDETETASSGGTPASAALERNTGSDTLRLPIILTPPADEVTGVAVPLVSLSGKWRFHASPPSKFFAPEFDVGDWATIQVPGEWFMQGFSVPPHTAAGYRRTFHVPDDFARKRVKLRFDAVYSDATIWVNGHKAGHHLGGLTAFEFDITELVRPGADNTLALAVRRESVADLKLTTFGTAYIRTPLGGIPRKITLSAVPPLHLAACDVATTFDDDYRNARLQVMLKVANQGAQPIERAQLAFSLVDPEGSQIDISPAQIPLPTIESGAHLGHQIAIPVTAPAKWDCEHPRLYVLTCRVLVDGKLLESVRRRVGFRQVEVRGRQLFVNNRPVKLRGVCRHERHATLGRSLTPELWRRDIGLFRSANINLIRTSHYPPPEELLDLCDELGMFVEVEAPFHHSQYIIEPEYRRLTLQQTAETVEHHRNHPSVLIWSLGNESHWSPNFEASAQMVRRLDPTRPRLFSGGDHYTRKYKPTPIYRELEINTEHYPGLEMIDSWLSKTGQPLLFDEYCHLNCYNLREQATDPGIRDDWGDCLLAIWEKMYAHEACLGGALWGGIDEIVFPPSGPPAGWGAWGLIDAWHRPKPEYWHAKKVYSPVRIATARLPLPADGEPIRVPVANRHDFTNINELKIAWTLNGQSGTVTKSDIRPRTAGELLLQPSRQPRDGDILQLHFHSPQGFLVDTYRLTLGEPPAPQLPAPTAEVKQELRLVRGDDSIVAANDRFAWKWNANTGLLREATLDGQAILSDGPRLMLLPRKTENHQQTYLDDEKHEPFTATCTEWRATSVNAEETESGVQLRVEGQYREAKGSYRVDLKPSGQMAIDYRFAVLEEIDPRQIGLVMDLPRSFDSLAWRRRGLWTVYPPDHIGRIEGRARAARDNDWASVGARELPPWPWSLDSTALGTNDFRATRTSVLWASLCCPAGQGLLVDGDGRQSVRTWLDGQRVRLLVADYSTGSGETFLVTRSFWQPHLLKAGSVVEGRIRLRLAANGG